MANRPPSSLGDPARCGRSHPAGHTSHRFGAGLGQLGFVAGLLTLTLVVESMIWAESRHQIRAELASLAEGVLAGQRLTNDQLVYSDVPS